MSGLMELDEWQVKLVAEALLAIRDGPWLAGEFHTRTGIEPRKFAEAVEGWPEERESEAVKTAIRCALREVALGIRFTPDEWSQWFPWTGRSFARYIDCYEPHLVDRLICPSNPLAEDTGRTGTH